MVGDRWNRYLELLKKQFKFGEIWPNRGHKIDGFLMEGEMCCLIIHESSPVSVNGGNSDFQSWSTGEITIPRSQEQR